VKEMLDEIATYLMVAPLVSGLVLGVVVAIWLVGPRSSSVRVRVRSRRP
jgi:hypothetical protein